MIENDNIIIPEVNYMITQEQCGACEKAKEMLKEPIKEGKIILIDIDTPEGLYLAKKHKVEGTPTIINRINNKFEQVCHLSKDAKKIYCDDGSEKVI